MGYPKILVSNKPKRKSSTKTNSTRTNSTITNSTITNSTMANSTITNPTTARSTKTSSTTTSSTKTNSTKKKPKKKTSAGAKYMTDPRCAGWLRRKRAEKSSAHAIHVSSALMVATAFAFTLSSLFTFD